MGLSPYTRGNPKEAEIEFNLAGSIPVHTGKPTPPQVITSSNWVYPRTHGETTTCASSIFANLGLSPYTRGNLSTSVGEKPRPGSIPVHTGKPSAIVSRSFFVEVYPRTHGETYEFSCKSIGR